MKWWRLDAREDNCYFVTSMSSDMFGFVWELDNALKVKSALKETAMRRPKYSSITLIAAVLAYTAWDEYSTSTMWTTWMTTAWYIICQPWRSCNTTRSIPSFLPSSGVHKRTLSSLQHPTSTVPSKWIKILAHNVIMFVWAKTRSTLTSQWIRQAHIVFDAASHDVCECVTACVCVFRAFALFLHTTMQSTLVYPRHGLVVSFG